MKKQFLETGIVVTTHGLKGEFKINPWSDSPEFVTKFKTLYLDKGNQKLEVETARVQKNTVLIKVKGIDTPEDAVKLRNKVIYVDRNDVKIGKDVYFVQDLIGMKVFDADTEALYGTISDVTQTGANDVYHIDAGDKTLLVPAIPDVIIDINVDEEKMTIRPLKGLFDDED